jgi:hypothetical protein
MSTVQRVAALVVLAAAGASCGSDNTGSLSPDVVLLVESDTTGAPDDVVFAAVPEVLVTVDGVVIYAAPEEFAIQGELVPDVWVQTLSSGGVDIVSQAVDEGSAPTNMIELQALVGTELGPTQFLVPDVYRFQAVDLGPESEFDDPDTRLIPWPDTVSLELTDADACVRLPEIEVGELFETAAADSAFVDDGIVYGVVAAQDWPGAPC